MNNKIPFLDKETGELITPNSYAVKTQYNAAHFPKYQETNDLPSITVPDQTLSVKELLVRHQRGLPITGANLHPIYHGEEEMADLRKLDLSELHQLKAANDQFIYEKQLEEKLELQKQNRETREKEIEAEIEKRLKAKQDASKPV